MRRTRAGGFTLIELLVVMGILVILMTALLTSIGSGTDKARQLACMSNLRQLYQASLSYAGDHNQALPSGPGQEVLTNFLVTALVEDTHGAVCPASKQAPPTIRPVRSAGGEPQYLESADWDRYPIRREVVSGAITPETCSYLWNTRRMGTDDVDDILAADRDAVHKGGRLVLFASGRVEWIRDGQAFRDLSGTDDLK